MILFGMKQNINWGNLKPNARIASARTLVARMGFGNLSSRIGIPCRAVIVKESVSEKAKRVWAHCDFIMGK